MRDEALRMRIVVCIVLAAPSLMTVPGASAATYSVRADGLGDFPTIQAAVDFAQPADVIQLTDGIFTGPGNRDIDFSGKAIAVTSASGDPATCVIDCEGSEAERHCGVVFHSGEGPDARLTSVGIRNGYAQSTGGGIRCSSSSSPTITNCVVSGCLAEYSGGALYIIDSAPTVSGCTFEYNSAPQYGGGVYCSGGEALVFERCAFVGNAAGAGGGGLACHLGAAPASVTAVSCLFEGNHAYGGGGMSILGGSLELEDCVLRGNVAEVNGGVEESSEAFACRGCLFIDNAASGGAAALGCADGAVEISDCVLAGNHSQEGSSIRVTRCVATMTGCSIVGNRTAVSDAALHCYDSEEVTIEATLIVGSAGGAVLCGGCAATLVCCDVFGNASGNWTGCIADQLGQGGNLSVDPQFCSESPSEDENWSIQCDSPCAPAQSACGLIGAVDVGCGSAPVEQCTWGGVKLLFTR